MIRVQLAYEFPDLKELDTQIGQAGPAGKDWIRIYIFKLFTLPAEMFGGSACFMK